MQDFFDVTKTVVVEGKKKDVNGVCTKKDGDCRAQNIYDSRFNDMVSACGVVGGCAAVCCSVASPTGACPPENVHVPARQRVPHQSNEGAR